MSCLSYAAECTVTDDVDPCCNNCCRKGLCQTTDYCQEEDVYWYYILLTIVATALLCACFIVPNIRKERAR